MSTEYLPISIFVAINFAAFWVIGNDKNLSRQKGYTERIPEGLLFFIAIIFGGIGIYLGMRIFRHKTRKWYFEIGIPIVIFQNLATIYLISKFLT